MEGGTRMSVIYTKPKSLNDTPLTFCPGCTHGLILKLVTTVIDELDIGGDTISVGCVGCGGYMPWFMNIDTIYSLHGRAPANATGIKRMNPDKFVFTYQGDGDLASIGTAEIVHAAHRGEKITTIFVNNTTYGMTGGQMAPTTLPGQKTTTSPYGRDPALCGYPLRVCEMLSTIDGAKYIERVSVDSPGNVRKAKKAIKRAFECQKKGLGFSLVEILSTCPTNWGMTPVDALERIRTEMIPYYPLGNFKDFEGGDL
jgi:2-oxoglutarate ferredoxin oxidoreductase subunit beta